MIDNQDVRIAVIGLGYVGLPLAAAFGRHFPTMGFDVRHQRIEDLRSGVDVTRELGADDLVGATRLSFSSNRNDLIGCNVFIVAVPTPIDLDHLPDLEPLRTASELVGSVMIRGSVVVFESTVYPGCTEEYCVPILERVSGLEFNRDFFAGYSPERINPGDRKRRLATIVKITSGSTDAAAAFVDGIYRRIIEVGTHRAESIRVAEAAKVIENVQRDVNIALVNELALIFKRLDIDTEAVLRAAATKWNFQPFRPGLVGGHCIGVDPYYLVNKAERAGYHPALIAAARQINESIGTVVSTEVMRLMTQKRIHIVDADILVLGFAFKENCPDLRNTRVIDIVRELRHNNANVEIYDPWVDPQEAQAQYGVSLISELPQGRYRAVVVAVAHEQFVAMGIDGIKQLCQPEHVIYDIKYVLPVDAVDGRL